MPPEDVEQDPLRGTVHTLGLVNANRIPWTEFKMMMTTEYCPAIEIQKMEQELWTLTLKGDDIEAYNNPVTMSWLSCVLNWCPLKGREAMPSESSKVPKSWPSGEGYADRPQVRSFPLSRLTSQDWAKRQFGTGGPLRQEPAECGPQSFYAWVKDPQQAPNVAAYVPLNNHYAESL
ncbi:hypothetical protein Tco_0017389 [Tanacetum coccineum]